MPPPHHHDGDCDSDEMTSLLSMRAKTLCTDLLQAPPLELSNNTTLAVRACWGTLT